MDASGLLLAATNPANILPKPQLWLAATSSAKYQECFPALLSFYTQLARIISGVWHSEINQKN